MRKTDTIHIYELSVSPRMYCLNNNVFKLFFPRFIGKENNGSIEKSIFQERSAFGVFFFYSCQKIQ